MALSLDDKLLGEKVHYYCSSDEGEGDEENDERQDDEQLCEGSIRESVAWDHQEVQAESNGIVTNVSYYHNFVFFLY